jgi:polysaccharide deacetylase 2 family uncharacterized protein YibQ
VAAAFPNVPRFLAGWAGLGRFWVVVLLVLITGAGVIQVLGPSASPAVTVARPVVHTDPLPAEHTLPEVKPHDAPQPAVLAGRPGRNTAGPIADPDPSLQEPYPGGKDQKLPRISPDGRTPMAAYAAGFDPSSVRPKVGILIAGIGMNEAESLAEIKDLPEGVTLAISPYAGKFDRLLAIARMTEHEYLLSIPMEPQGYPANDPDDRRALMTSLTPADNLGRLRWVLSRVAGYVGVTSAMGQMRGERLMGTADQLDSVLEEVAHRGLLFVDARTGQPPLGQAWNRSVDVVIDDDPVNAATLDQRLDVLTHLALDKGSALGLVSLPRPVTLARVAAWSTTLVAKGLALTPVSALALPPAKQEPRK